MEIKFKSKIIGIGESIGVIIPKSFSEMVKKGETMLIEIKEAENGENDKNN